MNTTRTLLLAGFAALSLGAASAMAQESAGGFILGPYDQQNTTRTAPARSGTVLNLHQAPQYGSADHRVTTDWPVLQGGDGQ